MTTLQLKEFRGVEPIVVTIRYYLKRDRDVDGSHKIILDAMQDAEVVVNDSSIVALHLYKLVDKKNPRVVLEF
jgi:Holliday junction resolvase RusA-like endonuclease